MAECDDVPPLWIDGILQVDQSHNKCVIGGSGHSGSSGSVQYRIAVDPVTKRLKPLGKGGRYPERKRRLQPKYSSEAKGCYAVACPVIDGETKGQMMRPWNYTNKWLLSAKKSDQKMKEIMTKYRSWRGTDAKEWKKYKEHENPFQARYGDEWESNLKATASWNKQADIRNMLRHIFEEGNRVFKGS